jgi:putative transposase
VWAYGCGFDTCANGQTLKCLTIIDEWTRECLAIDVAGGIRSGRVIEVLTQLVSVHGAPRYLRSDKWAGVRRVRDPPVADRSADRDRAH